MDILINITELINITIWFPYEYSQNSVSEIIEFFLDSLLGVWILVFEC